MDKNSFEKEAEKIDEKSSDVVDSNVVSESDNSEDNGKIIRLEIEQEMKTSFLEYAMSVIVSRALPDVRDGFKPVHRRILYAMNEMGMYHSKPFKKSARIVGEVLGKYHPHGDAAVYGSLVRMVQDFSLRYPLIDGQGNFGSVDGDSAAAMRYTEARLAKLAEEMLADIEKNTVPYRDNFDASLKEPSVLPAKFPNLLVNGSSGIAVGMATNIPPHNLTEVCKAVIEIIDNPDISVPEILKIIPGPDFPTGGEIWGKKGIYDAYDTGKGKIRIKSKTHIEQKGDNVSIIVDEIPYMVNKAMLIEQIANLVKDKRITEIRDLRDESDRKGTRIVIELKRAASPEVILNQLFKHTRMQVTFGIIMLSLVNDKPVTLGIIPIIKHYINHRQLMIKKRTEFDLNKAEKRAHILEGLLIALKNIDSVIKLIRGSESVEIARSELISEFSLSDVQAQAILEMRLQKLAALEREKIIIEHKNLMELIQELKSILSSQDRINNILKDEMTEIIEKYGNDRKTELVDQEDDDIDIEDLIEEHDVVVTITKEGYIKRLPLETYKQQHRGGRGIKGTDMKEEDIVEDVFVTSTHNYILFFTTKGKVYWQKVYQLPEASRQAKGKPIINMIRIDQDERINAWIAVKEFSDKFNLVLCTKKGIVKKSSMSDYSRPRKGGIIAINLAEDDSLVNAVMTDNDQQILIATRNGLAIKFHEKNARVIGRTSKGVKGITLKPGDEVMNMVIANDEDTLLTITENGYGKRTKISEYRRINRGGMGVINIQCTERNGKVVDVKPVTDEDDMIFMSQNGIIIRTPVRGISMIGRNTQGVRIMKLAQTDKVVAAAKVKHDAEENKSNLNKSKHDDNLDKESIEDSEDKFKENIVDLQNDNLDNSNNNTFDEEDDNELSEDEISKKSNSESKTNIESDDVLESEE